MILARDKRALSTLLRRALGSAVQRPLSLTAKVGSSA